MGSIGWIPSPQLTESRNSLTDTAGVCLLSPLESVISALTGAGPKTARQADPWVCSQEQHLSHRETTGWRRHAGWGGGGGAGGSDVTL